MNKENIHLLKKVSFGPPLDRKTYWQARPKTPTPPLMAKVLNFSVFRTDSLGVFLQDLHKQKCMCAMARELLGLKDDFRDRGEKEV